jgi:hypothetical protein
MLKRTIPYRLYIGFLLAFIGAVISVGPALISVLILAIGVMIIIGDVFRSLPQCSDVSEEIYRLQVFLLVASLAVVIFWYVAPSIVSFISYGIVRRSAVAAGGPRLSHFALAWSTILTDAGPILSLAGLIIAFFGVRESKRDLGSGGN